MNDKYTINQNEVHVWNYPLNIVDTDVEYFYGLLTDEEKKGIDKIRLQGVRDGRVISKVIVKDIISKYLGVNSDQIKYSYNRFGKPVLPEDINFPGLNFNISHSESLGIIALVKQKQIGVDLERIIDLADLDDIIKLCFSKNEQGFFKDLEGLEKTKLFYKVWTGKEAFIKAIGKGFSFPLENISFELNINKEIIISEISDFQDNIDKWHVYNFSPEENYTSTIVVNMNSFLTKKFYWNQTELACCR
ncbi:MAG TPA: 4'-phosphopantetheinyl transferase superfamily protein [Ignavibacteriaceae bacterium]|nr:4'-phosphopantetheinyl transferase superfamily protein [Ignavibacteriaceae bacterium]